MQKEPITAVDEVVTAPEAPGPRESHEDLALVQRLLAGDEAAFSEIVQRYQSGLIRLAMVFVASREVAEEVAQETWLAVLQGLASFEGRSALKGWIFSILTNRAKTRAVREKRSIPFSELSMPGFEEETAVEPERFTSRGRWSAPPGGWDEDTPEKLLLRRESRALIEKTMEALPPNQRAVITLRDVEGLDAAEVCNVLDLSETNQRVLLHRGRSKVRAALERYLARA
jgi:RNA polymerase sigma-70 factor, ECF subfamily